MKSKFLIGLATLTMTFALLLSAAGKGKDPQNGGGIDPGRRPPVGKKVSLLCKIRSKEAAAQMDVLNNTSQALPANQLIYYSTDKNVKGSFKTSNVIQPGQDTTWSLQAAAGSTCQAWVLQ